MESGHAERHDDDRRWCTTGGGTGLQRSEELGRWADRARAGDEPAGWQLRGGGRARGAPGVVGVASASRAMAATPFPGPTGCAALEPALRRRRGLDRDPVLVAARRGRHAARRTARGVTVTITRTGPTSIAWQASDGIDVVWVNAGKPPNASSAAYVYQPEATRRLGSAVGIGAQDPLDHVLVCFDPEQPATTAPPDDGAGDQP